MTQGRKSKGKKRKTEESQAPATQDEPQAPEVSEEQEVTDEQLEASQEMPPLTTHANIEFPDQVLDTFFLFIEENPVLWTNDKKYAFQKKQKREEAWQRLILHLTEQFPDSDPPKFIVSTNLYFKLIFQQFIIPLCTDNECMRITFIRLVN